MTAEAQSDTTVGAVVIGRNEGARLRACLDSLAGRVDRVVYVDSGSTDGSVAAARARGAQVVELDTSIPFTAARARNTGAQALGDVDAIQFVDGDCTVAADWIATGTAALRADDGLVAVCGRRREAHPDASVWNRLINREWDTPIGDSKSFGGDALIRQTAFRDAGGFNDGVIAGEEPELCVRLRAAGWRIRRLDAEMTLHDAALTRATQWWTRARRAGYAYAQGVALHGAPPERHYVPELRRALIWGLALPLLGFGLATLGSLWAMAPVAAYGAQIARMWRRDGDLAHASALTLTKPAEALGALQFMRDRILGRTATIIEYK